MHFEENEDEQLALSRIEELNLPARPMIEINVISRIENEKELKEWLKFKLNQIPANSVIRFKSLDGTIKKMLTAEFMRSIVPDTMSYSISR